MDRDPPSGCGFGKRLCFFKNSYDLCIVFIKMGKNEYYMKIGHINVSYSAHYYPFLMNTIHK